MITADTEKRQAAVQCILKLIGEKAAPEDRELVLAFAPVVLAETPDRIVIDLPPDIVANRILRQYKFVVREMPPSTMLYRGLPGIHVSVWNPTEAEALSMGGSELSPIESTVVETHTLDAPFIFESLKNYFSKAGLRVFSAIHPIFTVRRQWERIVWIGGPHDEGSKEVFCHFRIEPVDSRERMRRIEHEIYSVLKAVFLAVEDFAEMERAITDLGPSLRSRVGKDEQVQAARQFLDWLADDNYIFLGTARYSIDSEGVPERIHDTVTGVFSDATILPVVFPGLIEDVEAHIRPAPGDDRIIEIDYCNNSTAIYHLDPIDDIVVREWAPDGALKGATLILGRFARGAFAQRADRIPLLRDKIDYVIRESGALPKSHFLREIHAVFNRLPMRELFYAGAPDLRAMIEPIILLMGDDEIAVYHREGHGYTALSIAVSRLRYSYGTEEQIKAALSDAFGPISFHTSADCGSVTVMLFYFDCSTLEHPVDRVEALKLVRPLVATWEVLVEAALEERYGQREGRRLFRQHVRPETRSGLYREITPPEEVPEDVRHFDALESRLEVRLVRRSAEKGRLHLYSIKPLELPNTLRTLQNMGLLLTEEIRIPLVLPNDRKCYLYRFEFESTPQRMAALATGEQRFVDALRAIDEERTTDDPLNGLVLDAGLSWREVELMRTLRNHLVQIRSRYNIETLNGVLMRNTSVSGCLFRLFEARFGPAVAGDRSAAIPAAEQAVAAAMETVKSLSEDEVLGAFDNLIHAIVRTNFFQQPERPVFSIKVDSRRVEGMPSPRPLFEIYVHSRLLEGIHLRGGKVARGGIRWSDRHDDFRTEILGLMKTQMVKNSIIVPVGSKGGFVLKGDVPARPALDTYLIDRYREFVSGLLDVTDNVVDGKILHPPDVIRHDGDDPYLVVAADKGTAHLSDTANSVSAQYGFWLGDAFASGGSVGYDHKKVGITARGTWECVKHLFRNLGMDIQREPFTAAGIGDMAGDVFGNGALMSRAMRLVAAFNHSHIFVDPNPDAERSYAERERLFRMPRSTWRDYDTSLISAGGGIFDRTAKSIPVSPEMKALLGLEADHVSGEEVIRHILTAKVDLLYNGGIGTYVKSSSEEHVAVGDRANDRVRVDAQDVRARVVGEGGNLGFTQKARLEFSANGGLINTDALDNSGGVDMSDHEVNIKILMDILVKKAVINGKGERNRILAEMTEEVADLVLADNRNQALAVTLDVHRSVDRYEEFVGIVTEMVGSGQINRADESIPARNDLLRSPQKDRGFPRPLLAVLLGYTKMAAFDSLLQTTLPDAEIGQPLLAGYFPKRLQNEFAGYFGEHPLRREIVATVAVNHVINNGGISLLPRLLAVSGGRIDAAIAGYLESDRAADAPGLRQKIVSAGLDARTEQKHLLDLEDALEAVTRARLEGSDAPAAWDRINSLKSGF